MQTVDFALTGFGGIGSRVAEELLSRRDRFRAEYHREVRLVGVCGSTHGITRAGGLEPHDLRTRDGWERGLTGTRFMQVTRPDVLVEAGPNDYVSGGPGLAYLRAAVSDGMHIVGVSKSALALFGSELAAAAKESGSRIYASGASASALPVVDFLRYDLAGFEITRVEAVLTGTTSFVLDAVTRESVTLDAAVAEAVRQGIAEPDPAFDLDGWDTAAKLVVIAGLAFGVWVPLQEIPRASVSDVTRAHIERWRAAKTKPALVGVLEREGESWRAAVQLREYASDHPFAATRGSAKGLFVTTERQGEYSLIGGASSREATVAAVCKDLEHLLAIA